MPGPAFLPLTNQVLRRWNEVELSSSNFATARGWHAQVKDAVNAAIRDIDSSGGEWPFNWLTTDQVCVPGQGRYAYPADTKMVDAEGFRLVRDPALGLNETRHLPQVGYDDLLSSRAYEEDPDAVGLPLRVAQTRAGQWLLSPAPDQAYTVRFEHYVQRPTLVAATDTTEIPTAYEWVIVDGACVHCALFRADNEAAAFYRKSFENGLRDMRRNMQPQPDYVRSTLSGLR